jgi:hypothetical protein
MPTKKRTMKIADEMKKKLVLINAEPRIGKSAGQNGDVQPIANTIDAMVMRTVPRIHRVRSD